MAAFPVPAGSVILVPGGPDNSLPQPPPGYWGGVAPPVIDNTLPPPPPGIWPPPVSIWPPTPLPPDYPMPPGSIWPSPGHPSHPIAPGGPPPVVGGGPAVPPGTPAHPISSPKYLVAIVAASQGGGLRVVGYTVVDPSLSVGMPLPGDQPHPGHDLPPGAPNRPNQGLPPTPQPKS
jgi:hypothetical protein